MKTRLTLALCGSVPASAQAAGEGPVTAALMLLVVMAVVLAVYFAPSYVATKRQHPDRTAIFVLNLALGWLLIPWVIAMVWAYKQPSQVIVAGATVSAPPVDADAYRKCPFCAEPIRREAVKCKHCGSELGAT